MESQSIDGLRTRRQIFARVRLQECLIHTTKFHSLNSIKSIYCARSDSHFSTRVSEKIWLEPSLPSSFSRSRAPRRRPHALVQVPLTSRARVANTIVTMARISWGGTSHATQDSPRRSAPKSAAHNPTAKDSITARPTTAWARDDAALRSCRATLQVGRLNTTEEPTAAAKKTASLVQQIQSLSVGSTF